MHLSEILNWGITQLNQHNLQSEKLDAELILAHLLGSSIPELYLNRKTTVSENISEQYKEMIEKRVKRIPVAYIIGETEFFGLRFFVTPEVLIPRPETELLVEETIELIKTGNYQPVNILELGTGSGCIAISLSKILANINIEPKIYCSEIDRNALEIARKNAQHHQVEDKINFCFGDLYSPLPDSIRKNVNLIVSNPPYIAKSEFFCLQPEVKNEPRIALDGGEKGDEYYKRIIAGAPRFLATGGKIILELGAGLVDKIKKIAFDFGYETIKVRKDYAGINRIIILGIRNG